MNDRAQPWLTAAQQQAWRAYLQLTGLLGQYLDREMRRDAGMPQAYYQILAMLSEAPNRSLRMADLAAAAWASPSRTSHAVARLEANGWVRRMAATGDRRGQIALLTSAGRQVLEAAAPGHARAVREILFDPLDEESLAAFLRICQAGLQQLAAAGVAQAAQ